MNILKLFGLFVPLFLISCDQDPVKLSEEELTGISDDVREKIINLGFNPQNAYRFDSGYIVEGDIFLSNLDLLSLPNQKLPSLEQYRTYNLVNKTGGVGGKRVITIYLTSSMEWLAPALNEAMKRYNDEKLAITFKRGFGVSRSLQYDIKLEPLPPKQKNGDPFPVGTIAFTCFFPSDRGDPGNLIQFNTIYKNHSLGFLATNIAHEIGHCIGFRHTDQSNRAISCNGPYDPEYLPEGAVQIPGTPSSASASPGSWMLACNAGVDRPFNPDDKNALKYLYGDNFGKSTVRDIDGNIYHTVKIGTQTWMVENLKTTRYQDGTPIPNVTNPTAWISDTLGAYCNYNNSKSIADVYGKLYNWYAVKNSHKLAPKGWHIPSKTEWITLSTYIGANLHSLKMREVGLEHWDDSAIRSDNSSGFTALGSGLRLAYFGRPVEYKFLRGSTAFHSSTGYLYPDPNFRFVTAIFGIGKDSYGYESPDLTNFPASYGLAVRCIKD